MDLSEYESWFIIKDMIQSFVVSKGSGLILVVNMDVGLMVGIQSTSGKEMFLSETHLYHIWKRNRQVILL